VSYHLGSVWPHDNALIVAGLRRYGLDAPALRIFNALFDAAANFRDERLPELFCGFERGEEQTPVRYPVACSPQAWAAGALPHALWSLLGLRADALNHRLRIVRPRLPAGLDRLRIGAMQVGGATLDLSFARTGDDGRATVDASVRAGEVEVVVSEDLAAPDEYR
jgi:glycogen debranching enzyme